jgi:anoctamin-10/anoctamin-7
LVPTVLGLCTFAWQVADGSVDIDFLPAYSFFIAIWVTVFLEFWKRKESVMRVRWGMVNFHSREQPRPEFTGERVPSPVDGKIIEHFPFFKKVMRKMMSQMVVWTFIMCVIGSIFAIAILRQDIIQAGGSPMGGKILLGVVSAAQIQISNVIYGIVALKLNNFENHRTASEYENALISKTFLFKFVNSYNSLFYIAFFRRFESVTVLGLDENGVEGQIPNKRYCAPKDCLDDLQVQLGSVFVSMILIGNTIEILIPAIKGCLRRRSDRDYDANGNEIVKSAPEEEKSLDVYESTFEDFDEMAIQFGYVTMFVVAFPLTPLLALLNNLLEAKVDSFKLINQKQRPHPHGFHDIGTWFDILSILSFMAVITNSALIAFNTGFVERVTGAVNQCFIASTANPGFYELSDNTTSCFGDLSIARVWTFVIMEHVIILFKFLLAYFVNDEPEWVTTHHMRQEYIVDVFLNKMEDQDDMLYHDDDDADADDHDNEQGAPTAKNDDNYNALADDWFGMRVHAGAPTKNKHFSKASKAV